MLQDHLKHFDQEKVQKFLSEREIEWSYNPPTVMVTWVERRSE